MIRKKISFKCNIEDFSGFSFINDTQSYKKDRKVLRISEREWKNINSEKDMVLIKNEKNKKKSDPKD